MNAIGLRVGCISNETSCCNPSSGSFDEHALENNRDVRFLKLNFFEASCLPHHAFERERRGSSLPGTKFVFIRQISFIMNERGSTSPRKHLVSSRFLPTRRMLPGLFLQQNNFNHASLGASKNHRLVLAVTGLENPTTGSALTRPLDRQQRRLSHSRRLSISYPPRDLVHDIASQLPVLFGVYLSPCRRTALQYIH